MPRVPRKSDGAFVEWKDPWYQPILKLVWWRPKSFIIKRLRQLQRSSWTEPARQAPDADTYRATVQAKYMIVGIALFWLVLEILTLAGY